MNRFVSATLLLAVMAAACKADASKPSTAVEPKTEGEKTIYALGLMLGRNLVPFKLTPAELDLVQRGVADAASGRKPQVDLETYGPKVEELSRVRMAASAEAERTRANAFVEAAAKEEGAVKTPSGLVFRPIVAGTGASPAATDTVRVHYRGSLTNGTEFDNSIKRGQPTEFPLSRVIPCWTEGLQRMKVGGKAQLVCPSAVAYGDQGRPPTIPGGATLVFEVELLEIKK